MRGKFLLVPVEIVPCHVHLSGRAWEVLFGKKNQPRILRPLSQRGQTAYRETVKIIGPKGKLEDVRVLGGVRKQTQVELTEVEATALGIKPVRKLSGRLTRTPGCKLAGPFGRLIIKSGVIIPLAHLHLNPKEAEVAGVKQGQEIEISLFQDKETKIKVVVRVHPSFKATLHILPDLAAKLWLAPTEKAILENKL